MAAFWKIAAHLAYNMFSQYQYLIVDLFFPPRRVEWDFFFLIAPLHAHCLLEVIAMNNRFRPTSIFVLLIVPRRYFRDGSFYVLVLKFCGLLAAYVRFHI